MQKIQRWLRALLCTNEWVSGLVLGPLAEAAEALAKAQASLNTRIHEDWMRWITGGPSGGIGRQHRFLRTPEGWTPSSVGRPKKSLDKATRDTAAKRDWELRLLLDGLGAEVAPLGRQAETEDQANDGGRTGGKMIETRVATGRRRRRTGWRPLRWNGSSARHSPSLLARGRWRHDPPASHRAAPRRT